jgi:hypothetical protein
MGNMQKDHMFKGVIRYSKGKGINYLNNFNYHTQGN